MLYVGGNEKNTFVKNTCRTISNDPILQNIFNLGKNMKSEKQNMLTNEINPRQAHDEKSKDCLR